jgi:prepilin-type N-terminal cleavage/methylation domain-containing protein
MKKPNTELAFAANSLRRRSFRRRSRGFTLIELMVAMVVFLLIAGTAFSVFNQHMQMITHQEGLSGVNLALRNATSQMQMDLSGAGQNLLSGAGQNLPTELGDFATGVVIQNNVSTAQGGTAAPCTMTAGYVYPTPSACFDSFTIFQPQNVGCASTTNGQPPILAISDTENISSSSTIIASDPNAAANLATDAGCFKAGDELILLQLPNGTSNPTCDATAAQFTFCISAVKLTAAPTVSGTTLHLTHSLTASTGAPTGCPGASCTDPDGIIYNSNSLKGYNFVNALSHSFSSPGGYVIDVGSSSSTISYSVVTNPADATDTQLQRCDSNGCAVLADQIVGFKVGAALWSNEASSQPDIANYFYDSSKYCSAFFAGANCNDNPLVPGTDTNDAYDFSLIRAVRVSIIGRTTPDSDAALKKFNNGFDNGPYLVQQASVVVDLRNLSIGDFQN